MICAQKLLLIEENRCDSLPVSMAKEFLVLTSHTKSHKKNKMLSAKILSCMLYCICCSFFADLKQIIQMTT